MRKEITIVIEQGRLTVTSGGMHGVTVLLLSAAVNRRLAEDVARLAAGMIGSAVVDAVLEIEGGE